MKALVATLVIAVCLTASLILLAQQGDIYPAARTGGNYMHNYYFPPAGSGTPWWPSWAPDGQWLAFAMDGSIWKVRAGETTAYEIAHAKDYLSSPEWSPDGKWLVYTADADGQNINLMIMNLQTGEAKALTTGNHINIDPAWSPDGKRLAYVRNSRKLGIFTSREDRRGISREGRGLRDSSA